MCRLYFQEAGRRASKGSDWPQAGFPPPCPRRSPLYSWVHEGSFSLLWVLGSLSINCACPLFVFMVRPRSKRLKSARARSHPHLGLPCMCSTSFVCPVTSAGRGLTAPRWGMP